MEENNRLLLKGAMHYGLIMGIYWVLKYLLFMFSGFMPMLQVLYLFLTLLVPVVGYQLTRRYRTEIGGKISFFHAWRFGMMLYFFAAMVVSLEHFVFYQFIAPPDFLQNTISQALAMLKDTQMNSALIETLGKANLTPIHMAIQGIFNNMFYGILLSVPVAALLSNSKGANNTPVQGNNNA